MNTIIIPLPEIDNILVYWKTRLVEKTEDLISSLEMGNLSGIIEIAKLEALNMFKKTLRDYRFQSIYLTKDELETCIQKGNELASNY